MSPQRDAVAPCPRARIPHTEPVSCAPITPPTPARRTLRNRRSPHSSAPRDHRGRTRIRPRRRRRRRRGAADVPAQAQATGIHRELRSGVVLRLRWRPTLPTRPGRDLRRGARSPGRREGDDRRRRDGHHRHQGVRSRRGRTRHHGRHRRTQEGRDQRLEGARDAAGRCSWPHSATTWPPRSPRSTPMSTDCAAAWMRRSR